MNACTVASGQLAHVVCSMSAECSSPKQCKCDQIRTNPPPDPIEVTLASSCPAALQGSWWVTCFPVGCHSVLTRWLSLPFKVQKKALNVKYVPSLTSHRPKLKASFLSPSLWIAWSNCRYVQSFLAPKNMIEYAYLNLMDLWVIMTYST